MTAFQKTELGRTKTLGERLRKAREEASLTLADVERMTQIRSHYLEAIENGNYLALPGSAYIKNFLKKYAEAIQVSPQVVLDLYERERVYYEPLEKRRLVEAQAVHKRSPRLVTPHLTRRIFLALIGLVLLGYLIFSLRGIFAPPALQLMAPDEQTITQQRTINVVGTTDTDASLTINGQEVFVQPNGSFQQTIELTVGINVITVTAKKKNGQARTILRHVLVEGQATT